MAVEEGKNKRFDMFTINIGISHDDNSMIAEFFHIYRIPNPGPKGNDEIFYFFVFDHFIQSGAFGIQDFSFQRQNRLEFSVSPLFCRPPAESPSTR